MPEETTYRLVSPADSPDLEALIAATSDAGSIGFTDEYQADLLGVHRVLADDLHGAVAVRGGRTVGMAFADIHPVQVSGIARTGVYLSHLCVHPDYQRRGIGHALSEWGLKYLADLTGGEVVLYAAIMQGNISLKLAEHFNFQATEPIRGGVVPVRKRPPAPQPGLEVRLAAREDLPVIAEGMNGFYREHNLWSPVSPDGLRAFLGAELAGVRPNQLYVVARGADILAGISLSDHTALVRMRIVRTSWPVRLLGGWLGVLPPSGVLRALTARRLWFNPGELYAGRFLWQTLRFRMRDRADGLGIAFDPRDRLGDLFQIPPWLPMFPARYLVRAPGTLEVERPTYCIAGP
jgi:GNAT superfamily N-acetyltransferase